MSIVVFKTTAENNLEQQIDIFFKEKQIQEHPHSPNLKSTNGS